MNEDRLRRSLSCQKHSAGQWAGGRRSTAALY